MFENAKLHGIAWMCGLKLDLQELRGKVAKAWAELCTRFRPRGTFGVRSTPYMTMISTLVLYI